MKLMRRLCTPLVVLAAAALASCDEGTTGPSRSARAPGELAPLLSAGAQAVPGQYIVVMSEDEVGTAGAVASEVVAQHGGRVHHTYSRTMNGFAASLSPEGVEALRRNPRVRYVSHDQMASLDSVQTGATWGLDRIDQRGVTLNGIYTFGSRTGRGVRVYVIDSGIRTSHPDFEGRASVGTDFVGDGLNGQDCRGHGTHVAGTIASKRHGVAREASVVSVRAFGCAGTVPVSTIIAAVEWVTANAQKPAVVNLSLGSAADSALNQAVRTSIASGLVYAVAAGNEGVDACTRSPASVPEAITVGATTSNDQRLGSSNWGSCLDLFAPGALVFSTWYTSDTTYGLSSGTSMAAAHVSGAAALHLQANPSATPAAVAAQITGTATARRLLDVAGSPNKLLFSRLTAEEPCNGIALNPSLVSLTFLRHYAAAERAAEATAAAPQAFVASSDAAPRAASAAADAAGGSTAATVASTVTGRFLLLNAATGTLDWEATTDQSWLTVQGTEGRLASEAATALYATADASTLGAGLYGARITVKDAAGVNAPAPLDVRVRVVEPTTLHLGEPHSVLYGGQGTETYFAVTVPAGTPVLTLSISGGTGDADMFVRYGDAPSRTVYNCANNAPGNGESCALVNPLPGTYYVMLYGWNDYWDVTLSAGAGGPPASPANAAVRPYTTTSVRFTWTDASGETGYTVSRRTETAPGTWSAWADAGTMPAGSVRFTQTATAGVTYQYRVRACNAAGCSPWTAPAPVAIPTAVPSPPFGATATATGATRASIAWTDGSTTEGEFSIARSQRSADGTWGAYGVVANPPADAAQYTVQALVSGATYRFQVSACNVVGCSAAATTGAVAMPTLPTAPAGLTGTVLSGSAVRLNWTDASTNEGSFQVSRAIVSSTGTAGAYVDVATLAPNQVQFTATGLSAGTTYRFRVRACNVAGCTAPATSANVAIAPVPAAPAGFAATPTSPTEMRVTWTDVAGETSYTLTRALRNADGTWGAAVTLGGYAADTALVDDTGLAPASTYRYQLRACNLSGCSLKITAVGVTPAS